MAAIAGSAMMTSPSADNRITRTRRIGAEGLGGGGTA
jgi:hypothetical protein